jgi:hypothetical protein
VIKSRGEGSGGAGGAGAPPTAGATMADPPKPPPPPRKNREKEGPEVEDAGAAPPELIFYLRHWSNLYFCIVDFNPCVLGMYFVGTFFELYIWLLNLSLTLHILLLLITITN